MIPYHRFLLASMLLPISHEKRLRLLKGHNCSGVSMEMLQNLTDSLIVVGGLDPVFLDHLKAIRVNSINKDYRFSNGMGFAIQHGLIGIIKGLTDKAGSPDESMAISLLSKTAYYKVLAPLFLCEQGPQDISTAMSSRFSKVIPVNVVQLAYYMFFQFGSMEEEEVDSWIDSHNGNRTRYSLKLAMQEHPYRVKDYLGLDAGIDTKYVAARILARSFAKFEDLSSVNHYEAGEQAMKWGKLSLAAGREHEKVKGGEFTDFLAQFQISLREADLSIVRDSGMEVSEHEAAEIE